MSTMEKYHSSVYRSYDIIRAEVAYFDKGKTFQMAIKSVNDSVGPHGRIPTFLV